APRRSSAYLSGVGAGVMGSVIRKTGRSTGAPRSPVENTAGLRGDHQSSTGSLELRIEVLRLDLDAERVAEVAALVAQDERHVLVTRADGAADREGEAARCGVRGLAAADAVGLVGAADLREIR